MPSVLVVDDDPDVRGLLETYLELEGFDVLTATNGCDALQRLRDARPSVILLDLMMPVMDGEKFRAAQLKDASISAIPVIVFSGKPDCAAVAKRLDAVSCITKPMRLRQVVDEIVAYCSESSP